MDNNENVDPTLETIREWISATESSGKRPVAIALSVHVWSLLEKSAGNPGIQDNEGYSINMNGQHYIDGLRIFWVDDLGGLGGVMLYDIPDIFLLQREVPLMEEDVIAMG